MESALYAGQGPASECDEVGLGNSAKRTGKRISKSQAEQVLNLFERVPFYRDNGFRHFEEIQMFVDGIGKDRVSDIACSFLKSFLVDYTYEEAIRYRIPVSQVELHNVYDPTDRTFKTIRTELPTHPETKKPLLLVPKRWLRHVPWLNYDTYFRDFCPQDDIAHKGEVLTRVKVLSYNRDHYDVIDAYVKQRARDFSDCKNDPLFLQIPVISAKRKLNEIKKLPTGKTDGADLKYEAAIGELLPSLLYPHLDFAQMQARTDSGVSIRDLIFYNNRSQTFLSEIFDDYGSKQITFEMKNVRAVEREHIDQINRYLSVELGRFGVLITRHPLKKAEFTRTIDLWSGQRKAVIAVSDADIEQMVDVFESKQRNPIDVITKKYVEFRRACP